MQRASRDVLVVVVLSAIAYAALLFVVSRFMEIHP